MNDFFRPHYDQLSRFWQSGGSGEVKRSAIAFVVLAVIAYAVCMLIPVVRETLFSFVFSAFSPLDVTDASGNLSAMGLFANNLQACTMIMLYGIIPFIHLPALALGMNAMVLGVLAAYYSFNGVSMALYFAALIPHGIFEFPALILAFAMGLYVCGQVTRRLRHDETALPLGECVMQILRLEALVLLPLLALSALMEAYVTPWVAALFF